MSRPAARAARRHVRRSERADHEEPAADAEQRAAGERLPARAAAREHGAESHDRTAAERGREARVACEMPRPALDLDAQPAGEPAPRETPPIATPTISNSSQSSQGPSPREVAREEGDSLAARSGATDETHTGGAARERTRRAESAPHHDERGEQHEAERVRPRGTGSRTERGRAVHSLTACPSATGSRLDRLPA